LRNASEQFGGSETTEPAWLPMDFGIGERFADSLLRGFVRESQSSFSLCTHGAPLPVPPLPPLPLPPPPPPFHLFETSLLLLPSHRVSLLCHWPCRVAAGRTGYPRGACTHVRVKFCTHTRDQICDALNRVPSVFPQSSFPSKFPLTFQFYQILISTPSAVQLVQLCDSMVQIILIMLHVLHKIVSFL